jgi:uncharacterized protein YecT (DUF1311 family)
MVLALLTLLAAGAHGPDTAMPIDEAMAACKATPEGGTTVGTIGCIATARKAWDAELNRAYQDLRKVLTDENKALLKEAQLAWIAFRDADLKAIAGQRGQMDGTIWGILAASRELDLTRSRALELRSRHSEITEGLP